MRNRCGNNQFPIQNFYLQEAVKDADGEYTLRTVATIIKDDQDRYTTSARCNDGAGGRRREGSALARGGRKRWVN